MFKNLRSYSTSVADNVGVAKADLTPHSICKRKAKTKVINTRKRKKIVSINFRFNHEMKWFGILHLFSSVIPT